MSDRPTPRTDAFSQRLTAAKVPASKTWSHWYCHAATLECELADARAWSSKLADLADDLRADLAEAREQRDRLATALRQIYRMTIPGAAQEIIEKALDGLKEGTP